MKVACYYRHSTDSEQQDKNSIERQQFECRSHCEQLGWEIVKEVSDKGESGAGDKKNLERLKVEVTEGFHFDCLVIYDQSRLTRKSVFKMFEDIAFLEEAGIGIACVEDRDTVPRTVDEFGNDIGTVIKGWKNHDDVLKAATRSVSGMMSLHQRGELSWIGKTPLGFNKSEKELPKGTQKVLVANDDIDCVRRIFQHFLGGNTIRSCVQFLEDSNRFRGVTDKNPSSQSVKHILRNPIYCGLWGFGLRNVGKYRTMNPKKKKNQFGVNVLDNCASVIEYEVEKAVSKEDFLKAQNILDSNQSKSRGAPVSAGHRYSGLLKCSNCGGAVVAHRRRWKKKGASQEHLVDYVCAASAAVGKKCRGATNDTPWRKAIAQEELDELLQQVFGTDVFYRGAFHVSLVEALARDLKVCTSGGAEFSKELAEIEIEEKKFSRSFDQLTGPPPQWLMNKWNDLEDRKSSILQEQAKVEAGAGISSFIEAGIQDLMKQQHEQFARYLESILDVSKQVVIDPEIDIAAASLKAAQEFLSLSNLKVGQEVRFYSNEDDEVEGVVFDVEAILLLLKALGLESINLNWRIGKRRGKPKQVIGGLDFTFSCDNLVTGMTSNLRDSSRRPASGWRGMSHCPSLGKS